MTGTMAALTAAAESLNEMSPSLNNVHGQNRIVFAGNQSIRKTCQRKQAGFARMHQKKKSDIPTFLFSFLHGSAARPSLAVSDELG